jgi:hypothetical protein
MTKKLLSDIFAQFGAVDKIFMVHTNKHALVTMARGIDAAAAMAALHAQLLPPPLSKRIFVEPTAFRTVDEEFAAAAKLVDPSTTAHVHVPGLHVVEDFVTEVEAAALLSDIDAREWHQTLQRRVQHYGWWRPPSFLSSAVCGTGEFVGQRSRFACLVHAPSAQTACGLVVLACARAGPVA